MFKDFLIGKVIPEFYSSQISKTTLNVLAQSWKMMSHKNLMGVNIIIMVYN